MSEIKDGGPAFPQPGYSMYQIEGEHVRLSGQNDYGQPPIAGLTMRDYFAAKAMEAIVVNYIKVGPGWIPNDGHAMSDIAKNSYEIADAMLKERERRHE